MKRKQGAFPAHRAFAAIWDVATRHESKTEVRLRQAAAARVEGSVLELGVGVGANWEHLASDVTYTGIEPDAYMVARASRHAAERGASSRLVQARAEALPFADGTFDSVLVTLTFCTIADPAAALIEVRRVLKPGGRLSFFEHVRPEGRFTGWLFDRVTPAWRRVGAGCHPNRRTADAIRGAGFEVDSFARRRVNGLPMIWGSARNPGCAVGSEGGV